MKRPRNGDSVLRARMAFGGLFAMWVLSGAATAADPAAPERLPVPAEAASQLAEKQVREVFAEQLAEAKDRPALARELAQQGRETNNKPEVRYAALRLAQSVATDAGDANLANEVLDLLGKHFTVSVPAEKIALLGKFTTTPRPETRAAALAIARHEFEYLATTDNYTDALALGRLALDLAKAARDKDAIEQITAQGREVRRRQETFASVQAALEKLTTDPRDAASHLTAGKWFWYVKLDAEQGLKHLAQGSDRALAAAAAGDLAKPAEAAKKLAVADEWFRLAAEQDASGRRSLLARAQHWYGAAAPQLTGLDKVRAEKRSADLEQELRPAEISTPSTTVATKPAKKSNTEWKPPAKNSQATFRTFLGVYMYWLDRKKMYPVVNLQVPNANLWTQEVQDKVRGRISFDEISYAGTARIAVPADGVYVLEADKANVAINGKETGGSGDISIRKGIHVVTFEVGTHGQPYIVGASIALRNKETGEDVPFFNSWQDIQRFLGTPIVGQRPLEVSGWEPTEENEVKLDPKTLKVVEP